MARIGVLLSSEQQQPGDQPTHYVSKTLRTHIMLDRLNGRRIAQEVSKSVIFIVAALSFQELKSRYSTSKLAVRPIPKLLPPQKVEPNLTLSYPARWMESNGRLLQKEVWMRHQPCPADCSTCKQESIDHLRRTANWFAFPNDEPIFWLFRSSQPRFTCYEGTPFVEM